LPLPYQVLVNDCISFARDFATNCGLLTPRLSVLASNLTLELLSMNSQNPHISRWAPNIPSPGYRDLRAVPRPRMPHPNEPRFERQTRTRSASYFLRHRRKWPSAPFT
jgi:hypothetical protein